MAVNARESVEPMVEAANRHAYVPVVTPDRIRFTDVFARFLRTSREDRDLSQSEVARRIGRKPQTVSEWEAAKYMPDTAGFEELLVVFGMDGYGATVAMRKAAEELQAERRAATPPGTADGHVRLPGKGRADVRSAPVIAPSSRRGRAPGQASQGQAQRRAAKSGDRSGPHEKPPAPGRPGRP